MTSMDDRIQTTQDNESPVGSLKELIERDLYMPFPFASSPQESQVTAGVEEWLAKVGLDADPSVMEMIGYTHPGVLAAYNGPTMGIDILQIAANQIAYQFIFDDQAEEDGRRRPSALLPLLCESITILRGGPPSTLLGQALFDLYQQVQEWCTRAQATRWAWRSREYVHGLLYEAVAQTEATQLGIKRCSSIRSLIAGVQPFYPLCEAAQSRELLPSELHHPTMRRLGQLSADAAVWIPDLFSAVKEQRAGRVINLALAYQREHQCSLPHAVTLAIQQINSTITEVERLYGSIKSQLSPAGIGYAEGMMGWIRGCYYWSLTVPRYADTAQAPGG